MQTTNIKIQLCIGRSGRVYALYTRDENENKKGENEFFLFEKKIIRKRDEKIGIKKHESL